MNTSTHHPIAIVADPDTLTCFLELKILEKLNATRIFGIILKTALSLPCQPLGERTSG